MSSPLVSPVSSTQNSLDGSIREVGRSDRSARVLDLALCLLAFGIFAPFFAFAAVWIRQEDGGPIFFRQARLGQGRRPFDILKFRTMLDGKDITRPGRWLRRTGLDETAQFFNVLRGEMRVVGPRPLTAADVTRLGWEDARFDGRWQARPGITGLAQVFGGRSASHSRRLDELYARHRSLGMDAWLITASFAMNLLGKQRVRLAVRAARRARAQRRSAAAAPATR